MSQRLSLAGFINKVALAPNNCKVEFTTNTVPKMNKNGLVDGVKTPNPYLDATVEKIATVKGKIKFNYASEVNKQRLNEGKDADFASKERAWGEKDGCFVSHKGELYIDTMIEETTKPIYKINGTVVEKSVLEPFLPSKNDNNSQGIDKQIVVRTMKLGSVKEAKIGTVNYTIS